MDISGGGVDDLKMLRGGSGGGPRPGGCRCCMDICWDHVGGVWEFAVARRAGPITSINMVSLSEMLANCVMIFDVELSLSILASLQLFREIGHNCFEFAHCAVGNIGPGDAGS